MDEILVRNFTDGEPQTFPHGRFEICQMGNRVIGRARYEPGWRWTRDIGPMVGTALCEVEHLGVVVTGRAGVRMADGTEFVLGPGDVFAIPAGHDSWVIGDQTYESIHLANAYAYAPITPAARP
jgi:hypothetical protein